MDTAILGGGVGGLLLGVGYLFHRYIKTLLDIADRRVRRMERMNDRCEQRLNLVIAACNQHGIQIPAEVWTVGEHDIEEVPRARRRRR